MKTDSSPSGLAGKNASTMQAELRKIPAKVNLELFDIGVFTKDKIREIFRGGKLPTADAMVEEIILRAVKEGATDIHIEPDEAELRVRLGYEGLLKRLVSLPKEISENIANVIKTKANLNQFEKKKPQEGRCSMTFAGHQFDMRVSTLPTITGERIALRLFNRTQSISRVDELGFSNENLEKLRRLLHRPSGLVLAVGSSGMGMSTIIFACLNELQSPEKNIITLENPVEFKLGYASQVQSVFDKTASPSDTLRPILRQSPNVLMLSEIRDGETGHIAAESALAGNLVLSTILATDALGTIPRLLNFGLSPYWVASSLAGMVYQKLIRMVCENCKEEFQPTNEELSRLGTAQFATFFKGKGCDMCSNSGYQGRTGIHEVLVIDDQMRDLIYRGASILDLKQSAYASGFEDIRSDAMKKVTAGITTLDEVIRSLG
jgi:type II secretory ATPase GspE/PulE/Tfp pilus assembly ATPase PilB-like protein